MATQWTAQGITSGAVLPAATLQSIGAAWVDYTPTLTQGATITKTISNARYCQIQKTIFVQVYMIATSAGTAGNQLVIGLPITARNSFGTTNGLAQLYDANTNLMYICSAYQNTTTTMSFIYQTGNPFGISPAITIANGDQLQFSIVYEAA